MEKKFISPKVKSIDEWAIKKRLKKEDKDAYELVMALERLYDRQQRITVMAMKKIQKLNKTIEEIEDKYF